MSKFLALVYGVFNYIVFLVVFAYLFGFTADVFVPLSVSKGGPTASTLTALLINLGLILFFGVQHSVMARPTFKAWWTRFIPAHVERSTYVLVTNLCFILIYLQWRPMPTQIWNLEGTLFAGLLWGIFILGMVVALASSFMIDHFDLFGVRQVVLNFRGKPYTPPVFKVTGFYKWIRNPLMTGMLFVFWAAPVMTYGRLLFSTLMTVYVFIGIYFEERNHASHLGESYQSYKTKTSMLLPLPRRK